MLKKLRQRSSSRFNVRPDAGSTDRIDGLCERAREVHGEGSEVTGTTATAAAVHDRTMPQGHTALRWRDIEEEAGEAEASVDIVRVDTVGDAQTRDVDDGYSSTTTDPGPMHCPHSKPFGDCHRCAALLHFTSGRGLRDGEESRRGLHVLLRDETPVEELASDSATQLSGPGSCTSSRRADLDVVQLRHGARVEAQWQGSWLAASVTQAPTPSCPAWCVVEWDDGHSSALHVSRLRRLEESPPPQQRCPEPPPQWSCRRALSGPATVPPPPARSDEVELLPRPPLDDDACDGAPLSPGCCAADSTALCVAEPLMLIPAAQTLAGRMDTWSDRSGSTWDDASTPPLPSQGGSACTDPVWADPPAHDRRELGSSRARWSGRSRLGVSRPRWTGGWEPSERRPSPQRRQRWPPDDLGGRSPYRTYGS
eukprot:TRINITY_DN17738_c0_g1_i1.p2 TRINITY_DN17738_c0_g1~~TRINITY_DN17738_c0_g1_i1.p2  ORF type:complete len:424 (+),score=142.56 TRINITY_DN17738_c0_g1_i1:87-1358(+)